MGQLLEGEHAPPYHLNFRLYGFVVGAQEDIFDGSALRVFGRAGCVDGIRGEREGLDDDECVCAGACDGDCG